MIQAINEINMFYNLGVHKNNILKHLAYLILWIVI